VETGTGLEIRGELEAFHVLRRHRNTTATETDVVITGVTHRSADSVLTDLVLLLVKRRLRVGGG
jgi:hypothetical protein